MVAPISEPVLRRNGGAVSSSTHSKGQSPTKSDRRSEVVERSFGLARHGPSQTIPAAAMPAPGFCRVWYDNRILESQPPIVPCEKIGANIPAGARLIVGRYR